MSHDSPAIPRDTEVYDLIAQEDRRQAECLTLIASENHCSSAVRAATGSMLTDKYAEGYPGRRYYGGCEVADQIENLAISRAKELFGAEHANVQAHSGTQANLGVYLSVLAPGERILGMALNAGGHLSHGFSRSHSGIIFDAVRYGIDERSGLIDYDEVERLAIERRPRMLIAGFSSYPRLLDWARMRKIADQVGAYFLADIAHPAGLIAAGVIDSPVGIADFVTMTTHKTLRGPRGGMILCKQEFAKKLDSSVFPGGQGGPFLHVIAGKAVAFGEALQPEFKIYGQQVLDNARVLGEALLGHGFQIVTGGTDNHLVMVDLRPKGLTGREAEALCLRAGLVVNKNLIPGDPHKAMETSGLRLGTAAPTTRGMTQEGMIEIAALLDRLISGGESEIDAVGARVRELAAAHPLPA